MPHEHQCCNCHNDNNHAYGQADKGRRGFSGLFRTYLREILSGVMLVAGIVLSRFGVFAGLSEASGYAFDWVSLLWFMAAVAPVAAVILADAWNDWRKGDFMNEFTLMTLAAVGAFFIGEYPEAVAVLLFYSFGEKMEGTASDDVRERIRSLIGRLPDKAYVVGADGNLHESDPKGVAVGTLIAVRPGERVPIDGTLEGDSEIDFDTSAITGESVPRSYAPGSLVLSGMIPLDKSARLTTAKAFADSSMSRMMKLIEDAAAKKSPTESMLRRITRWYTPTVMVLAALVFAVPWLISLFPGTSPFAWHVWLERALVFLVCSCPCALVVSIPLSYFASMGTASRLGLLFKDSAHIDRMRKTDTVVFDKTGTLTTGQFHIVGICSAEGSAEEEVLSLAAAVDASSAHPLAQAIMKEAADIPRPEVEGATTVPHGMQATLDGRLILVGSRKLLQDNGIAMPSESRPYTEVCVAAGGRYIGSVYLEDTLKPEAADAVARLHKTGAENVIILSGDREQAVASAAKAAGADSWQSQLLPADKQRIIDCLRSEGHVVAFVGDGINDAPSIASADIGIAMGTHGTDMAMESADVVIAGDNLSTLPKAMLLARRVHRVVVCNVAFALGVKAAVMILGAFGIASLWAAVFADTGVTAITIIYTLLALTTVGNRHTS